MSELSPGPYPADLELLGSDDDVGDELAAIRRRLVERLCDDLAGGSMAHRPSVIPAIRGRTGPPAGRIPSRGATLHEEVPKLATDHPKSTATIRVERRLDSLVQDEGGTLRRCRDNDLSSASRRVPDDRLTGPRRLEEGDGARRVLAAQLGVRERGRTSMTTTSGGDDGEPEADPERSGHPPSPGWVRYGRARMTGQPDVTYPTRQACCTIRMSAPRVERSPPSPSPTTRGSGSDLVAVRSPQANPAPR